MKNKPIFRIVKKFGRKYNNFGIKIYRGFFYIQIQKKSWFGLGPLKWYDVGCEAYWNLEMAKSKIESIMNDYKFNELSKKKPEVVWSNE